MSNERFVILDPRSSDPTFASIDETIIVDFDPDRISKEALEDYECTNQVDSIIEDVKSRKDILAGRILSISALVNLYDKISENSHDLSLNSEVWEAFAKV